MNKKEQNAFDLWKRNQELDFSKMSIEELILRAKQQDTLYLLATRRLDKEQRDMVE